MNGGKQTARHRMGTKDGSPLDLRTENELVLLYSLSPSTTAPLVAAV